MTHTVATLEISAIAFQEITDKLRAASYDHLFMADGSIDMYGIGLARTAVAPSDAAQAPTAWVRFRSDGGFEGPIMDCDSRMCDTRRTCGAWTPLYAAPVAPAAAAPVVQALTADDADMVWATEDGETFFHTIDDAVDYEVDQAWPTTGPLELKLSLGKKIPNATVRIFNITENGHEWEILPATRGAAQ